MEYYASHIIISLLVLVFAISGCSTEPDNVATSADGVPIHFTVQGKGSPALVFVHGWCCDKSYWDAQVHHFAQTYKVVTIDLAGHGESGPGREVYTMEAFGEDVAAVLNKLGLDRVVLIGHSMGGPVILEASLLLPDRVIGLVGADTYVSIEQKIQVDERLAPFRDDFVQAVRDRVRTAMFIPSSDSALVEKIVKDMSMAPPEVGLSALESLYNYGNNKFNQALRKIQAPIQWINRDRGLNIKYAESFKVKYMSGVGHFVMIEDPETFNRLLEVTIQEFLR